MQCVRSKDGLRRKRCSFVKVDPTESPNPFGNEVNAQFFPAIPPSRSAGFHGGRPPRGGRISHFQPSPWRWHKDICWWMLHVTFLLCVQVKVKSWHTSKRKKEEKNPNVLRKKKQPANAWCLLDVCGFEWPDPRLFAPPLTWWMISDTGSWSTYEYISSRASPFAGLRERERCQHLCKKEGKKEEKVKTNRSSDHCLYVQSDSPQHKSTSQSMYNQNASTAAASQPWKRKQ